MNKTEIFYPKSIEEIVDLLKYANKNNITIYTDEFDKKDHGIILNKHKLDKLIDIDIDNHFITIEAGITYSKLHEILKNKEITIQYPINAENEFVLDNFVKQKVILGNVYYRTNQISNLEIVLPSGRVYNTGAKSLTKDNYWREDGGPNLNRLFLGTKEYLGIISKGTIFAYPKRHKKLIGVGYNNLEDILNYAQKLARLGIGDEIIILNKYSLQDKINDFIEYNWIIFINILENYYEYQGNEAKNLINNGNLIENNIIEMAIELFKKPWYINKNYSYLSCYTLFHYISELYKNILKILKQFKCDIVPIENGRSVFLQFEFEENDSIKRDLLLFLIKSEKCVISEVNKDTLNILNKNQSYKNIVRKIKRIFDKNNILNPISWL
ncbi:MAG: FAD-binding protein [Candidatus Helarchaeota archaeon]